MKKKSDSQKKGDILERFSVRLLKKLANEWGFQIYKVRREKSGAQRGKDVIYKISTSLKNKEQKYLWYFEDKHYKDSISSEKLEAKLNEAHRASFNIPIDCWCILLPKAQVSGNFSDFTENESQQMYSFGVVCWTIDEEIEKLIACFPDLYRELFETEPKLEDFDRNEVLKFWKKRFLEDSEKGRLLREAASKRKAERRLSSSEARQIAVTIAKEINSSTTRNIIKTGSGSKDKPNLSPLASTSTKKSIINEQIDEALEDLNNWKTPEALSKFLTILAKVEGKEGLEREHARVLNNIGVAYSRMDNRSDEAISYFRKCLEADGSFIFALTNLAGTYIGLAERSNKSKRKELLSKAAKIIEPLIQEMPKGYEPNITHIYLRLLKTEKGANAVSEFVKNEANAKYSKFFSSSPSLSLFLGSSFLETYELDLALEYVQKSVKLKADLDALMIRGRVYLAKALQDDTAFPITDFQDIAPKFRQNLNIEKALKDFQKAQGFAIDSKDRDLYQDVTKFVQVAYLWLGRKEPTVDADWPYAENKYVKAVKAFRERSFEVSFELLRESAEWRQLPIIERWRLARIYLYNGAIEISRNLLVELEPQMVENKVFDYWLDRSMVEALLENKDQAILAASKAKEFAKDEDQKRVAYSHAGAVLVRYAKQEGGDRLLKNALEFDKEFPQLGVVTRIDFEKEKDKIIEDVKARHEWVSEVQKLFKDNLIPSYYLEKIFHKPYITVWSGRDPMLPIEYTITSDDFSKELQENFQKGRIFILDYITLLTLSKLNMLYQLESLLPNAQIPFSLFQKIQEELLQEENRDLRNLWEFLRKTKTIEIVKKVPDAEFVGERLSDLFDPWFLDVLRLSKQKGAVLVTDDFRVYRFSKSENIVPLNTWFILNMSLDKGIMDQIMYSKALGTLASCFYTFIGFKGEDLYQIVADDDYKLTARSYHLLQQVFLSGSNPVSFTHVFVTFIWILWHSGALAEDKVYWLSYLTNIFTDLVNHSIKNNLGQEVVTGVATDTGYMWNNAVSLGRKDDLVLLQSKLDEILKGQKLENSKDVIISKLEKKIAEMS